MMEKSKQKRYILFFLVRHSDNKEKNSKGLIKRTKTWVLCTLLLILIGLHLVPNGQIKSAPTFITTLVSHDRKSSALQRKQEIRHIAFLKVHKAGGSTLQNIFFRFGSIRNLTFILPTKGYKFSTSGKYHEPIIDPPPGKDYNILAIHSVFNLSTFTRYFPYKSTVYIGIIRDPLELMISAAFYHRDRWNVDYLTKVPTQNYIQNLIHYADKYDQDLYSLTRNPMAMDFGFPKGLTTHDQHNIGSYLDHLNSEFDIILIMEYFPQSIVLMRRTLHWDFKSILYIPVNENKHPSMEQLNISSEDKQAFKVRNFLDVALYDYFLDVFAAKVAEQSSDFPEEVKHFSKVQRNLELYCLVSKVGASPLVVNSSEWHGRFLVFPHDCDTMKITELDFIDVLRNRHIQEIMDTL